MHWVGHNRRSIRSPDSPPTTGIIIGPGQAGADQPPAVAPAVPAVIPVAIIDAPEPLCKPAKPL